MSWEVEYRNGVYLPQIDWWLDAHHPVKRCFVSHAHFDHLAKHEEVICSDVTGRLMAARLPAQRTEHRLPFDSPQSLHADGTCITLYPAGHIFGSAQCLITHPERGRLLYTGDFKLRRGRSAEPCATPQADVVIMETTYGRPHYVFPPTDEVLAAITRFCLGALDEGDVPVLFGYSLGKSQEILASLSEANLPVMLHPQTLKMTRIYEELGLRFPSYQEFDETLVKGHVVIAPPLGPRSGFLKKIPRRRTATITGWALDPGILFRSQCDAAFPLSDHADFQDLLEFVDKVSPRRVLTLHGFAADFARTLRNRGMDAWAINQDNQIEFALKIDTPDLFAKIQTEKTNSPLEPDTLDRLAEIGETVKVTPRKLEKVELLSSYLESLSPEDAARAALYFTGRAFPQSSEQKLQIGWALIRRALLEVTGLAETEFRQVYSRYRDSGETAQHILRVKTRNQPLPLAELGKWLDHLSQVSGTVGKLDLLISQFRRVTPTTAMYLIKIITGDLRIGLKEGLVEEAVAKTCQCTTESIREANLLCGDLPAVFLAAKKDRLAHISLRVFHPLQCMLASPEPTAEAILERLPPPVWLENKYDGIRCQLHKQDSQVELFSRDLKRITDSFPDLVDAIRKHPENFILDGELLAWRDGRALPFFELQKRLGRKQAQADFFLGEEIPIGFMAFDLLWLNGNSLLKQPLHKRREHLDTLISQSPSVCAYRLHAAPVEVAHSCLDIEAAFLRAKTSGNEGLMAKSPESLYTPGRRGMAWLKLKKAQATVDVVVVAVEYGHGKRRGVLSDYTFAIRNDADGELLILGKAYSGLTDAEIARLTEHFLDNTLEERGRTRRVVPDTVLEIAFDSIHTSERHNSGLALRFPRIVRIRDDKTVHEIDTLSVCRKLAGIAEDP